MVASGVFGGAFTLEEGLACADVDGKTIGEELERIGYAGEMECGGREVGAFFEAHIEQGPILEAEEKTIGIVQGVQGISWFDVSVTGMESHAGTTPMERRRDALVGCRQAEEIAAERGLEITVEEIWHSPPVKFAADCVGAVQNAAETLGYASRPITSGAGHDAVYVHNEIEAATQADIAAGCDVLLECDGRARHPRRRRAREGV
ncbi:N-carbamoyl-L-amino-acid hydrolase [Geodia barretti]|uniref:N-carbamoyl-L-amino-acid hydrolase n=1 Tax=Geodia barretti TaxID=519541 RepID=A0AA35VZ72_GEOBA|nr:N-carbamoyl-L-amino-acid hydrolase [Geodia barretti]